MLPGDKVRATLGFILFDDSSHKIKENEKITFVQLVRDCFENWVNRQNDWIVRFTYKELPKNFNSDQIVFWQQDRMKFTAAIILYAIIPFYKFRKNKADKHGQLIIDLLDCLLEKKIIKSKDIDDLMNKYYWHETCITYLKKAKLLINMTDEQFNNLGSYDEWMY